MKQFKSLFIVFALLVGTAAMCVKEIPVDRVLLDEFEIEMTEGDTRQLTYKIRPVDATNQEVTWTSANPQVASVSSSGVVTALKDGSTDVTVTTLDGFKTAKCLVKVTSKSIPVKSVALDRTSCELYEKEEIFLEATVLPEDATDKGLKWTTDNSKVADVTSSGRVIAVSAGDAVITVTTVDGNFNDKCRVTVKTRGENVVPVTSVTLDKTTLPLKVGDTYTLKPTVLPEDATDKTVAWDSTDHGVASVSDNGEVIAFGEGKATITATCGGITATCDVTVTAAPSNNYDQWLGEWTVMHEGAENTWTISAKENGSTYSIAGIAGAKYVATAEFDPSNGGIIVSCQSGLGTLSHSDGPLNVGLYGTYNGTSLQTGSYVIFTGAVKGNSATLTPGNASKSLYSGPFEGARFLGYQEATGKYYTLSGSTAQELPVSMTRKQGGDEPASEWAGSWKVRRGAAEDTWSVAGSGSSYTITGIEGMDYPVVATVKAGEFVLSNVEGITTVSTSYGTASVGIYGQVEIGGEEYFVTGSYDIFTAKKTSNTSARMTADTVILDEGTFTFCNFLFLGELLDGQYAGQYLSFSQDATDLPNTMTKAGTSSVKTLAKNRLDLSKAKLVDSRKILFVKSEEQLFTPYEVR